MGVATTGEMMTLEAMFTPVDETSRSVENIKGAGELLGIAPENIETLINPQDVHVFRLHTNIFGKPVRVWGCTSFHNRARGVYKGGIRLSGDVNVAETIELSRLMTLKTAIVELELGGGKTGIKFDMRAAYAMFGKTDYDPEFERAVKRSIMREYAHHYRGMLAKRRYVPAPDMGTGPDEMVCIYNETHEPSSVTGKPEGVCGWLPGRAEATGYGVFSVIMSLIDKLDKRPEELTITIHGFGNVGANTAIFLSQQGAKVIGVVDADGGVYDAYGLNIPALVRHARAHGSVRGFGTSLTTEAMFALDVDICVPAAINDSITPNIANTMQARYVVEGANFPTTYEAVQILQAKGITIIPDIIANAGGVIASAEEFIHAVSTTKVTKEQVYAIIDRKIGENLAAAQAVATERGISLDLACTLLAVQRVYGTMQRHGWL